jgi:hypothetical protein
VYQWDTSLNTEAAYFYHYEKYWCKKNTADEEINYKCLKYTDTGSKSNERTIKFSIAIEEIFMSNIFWLFYASSIKTDINFSRFIIAASSILKGYETVDIWIQYISCISQF